MAAATLIAVATCCDHRGAGAKLAAGSPESSPPHPSVASVELPSPSASAAPPIAPSRPAPPPAPPPEAARLDDPPAPFAGVDWKNREYVSNLVQLVDGHGEMHEYSAEYGGMHDTTLWRLEHVAYGDVAGDPAPEAIVLISEQWYAPGGAHSPRGWLFVYTMSAGALEQVASTPAAGGTRVEVESRRIRTSSGTKSEGTWIVRGKSLENVP